MAGKGRETEMPDRKYSILIVDDEAANIALLKEILIEDYTVYIAKDGAKAIEVARRNLPDLILLDIMMPGMDGFETCRQLKQDPDTRYIPVIFVTAMSDIKDEAEGFSVGAADYIAKPVRAPIVRVRVRTQLSLRNLTCRLTETVQQSVRQFDRVLRSSIQMLGDAGHYNDTDTGLHIWRMAAYARHLARLAGWGEEDCQLLEMAAPMHDTGKIAIPDSILKKPGKLTPEEWEIMKTHSTAGADILSRSDTALFVLAAEIAASHHEKWDGSGYPAGLAGNKIPESGRIVALADVFDALTMRRPYKDAWPIDKTMDTIREGKGSHFDPALVDLFVEHLDDFLEIQARWQKQEQPEASLPVAHILPLDAVCPAEAGSRESGGGPVALPGKAARCS